MKPHIFELKTIGTGTLCMMPCPRAANLAEDMTYLMDLGVDTIVSLLERREAIARGVEFEKKLCEELGLHFEHFPIPDQGLPASEVAFDALIERLYQRLQAGHTLSVHCYAGIGRTGLVIGRLLMRDGMSASEAIEFMSRIRGRNMPQTQEQYEYLMEGRISTQSKPLKAPKRKAEPSTAAAWWKRLTAKIPA